MTTIFSTGVSVSEIEFPSVTFCSQGNSDIISEASLIEKYNNFLRNNYGIKNDLDPLTLNEILKVIVIAHPKLFC
jgi:hypothetical protein